MPLVHMVITILLSFAACSALYSRQPYPIEETKVGFASTSTVKQIIVIILSTLASAVLIKWILINSALTLVLLRLSTSFYLTHLACTIALSFIQPRGVNTSSNIAATPFIAPERLLPLGMLSLFISDQNIGFPQILMIGTDYAVTVGTYLLVSCWLKSTPISSLRSLVRRLWLTASCCILSSTSAYIAWKSMTHIY